MEFRPHGNKLVYEMDFGFFTWEPTNLIFLETQTFYNVHLIWFQMNKNTHIILCGQISMYNNLDQEYPPLLPDDMGQRLKDQNITRDRFLVVSYPKDFDEGLVQLATWVKEGKLKVCVELR